MTTQLDPIIDAGMAATDAERRGNSRAFPACDCTTYCTVAGDSITLLMKDVSTSGAGFVLAGGQSDPNLEVDQVIELKIETAFDATRRKARVAWQRNIDGRYRFGVEYLNVGSTGAAAILDLDQIKIDPAWALKLPASLALRRHMLPFAEMDGQVFVACQNTKDAVALQAVERMLEMPIRAELAEPASLQRALERIYGNGAKSAPAPVKRGRSVDVRNIAEVEGDDAVAICDELLHAAVMRQASDIHIDPERESIRVRLRVDGVLDNYRRLPVKAHAGVISRIKVLASMDISEKRSPQDGGFRHTMGHDSIDIRVATLPTKYGERMTMRLLALQTESLTLERLGLCERDLGVFSDAIHKPHGMILVTGPTGSGKSTTLYAVIRRLIAEEDLNVITIEDPIEYDIVGVAQCEVDAAAEKATFHKVLRSMLRHDPDVVMIGEIRDQETAGIAIKASLTGHLVFSTLHTNSACGAVTRLIDMGVERYLAAATLRLAMAQRLVRRLCPQCRKPVALSKTDAASLGRMADAGQTVFEPGGCLYCADRGYVGRIGLFELLPVDESLSKLIAEGADEASLYEEMRRRNVPTLLGDAVAKMFAGATSVQEVVRAVTAW